MTGATFLGLGPLRWALAAVAALAALLVLDALAGHARRRFHHAAMWTPVVVGGALVAASGIAAAWPVAAALVALRAAGWAAVAAGLVGVGFHHVYGFARRPGGYAWARHHLMYGAPQLAPLGLAGAGALGLAAAAGLGGAAAWLGVPVRAALLGLVALVLLGLAAQTAVLHWRGAFHNRAMGVPLAVAPLAAGAAAWAAAVPGGPARLSALALLWALFLLGFVGLGFHLRGFDRMEGGLYLPVYALFEGPPAWAPALYSAASAVGLAVVHLT